jgi:hypothetical protein
VIYNFFISDVLKARHKVADADLIQRGEVAEEEDLR